MQNVLQVPFLFLRIYDIKGWIQKIWNGRVGTDDACNVDSAHVLLRGGGWGGGRYALVDILQI